MEIKSIVSSGGVVIFRNKVLVLYKNQHGRHMGWVMPKGTIEPNETYKQAALREVKEEGGVSARIVKYLGKTQYSFKAPEHEIIYKTVHWYLMTAGSYHCKPQAEEFFIDAGFYKQHEAYHLLKFHDERQVVKRAFAEYDRLRKGECK
ncbi:MAG: NUDIX domain-containing protein [Defluviitaleaceae bacterium]|nr:NUDIX domain-containing protein [Defluviitaleaceae bacterium]